MNNYDLVVVGGGTAGCACAYTAGKFGLKVLLIEQNTFLGGSITSSLVIPAMKTSDNAINMDFYNKLYDELHKIGGAATYDNNKGWYNPELTKIVLDKLMKEANVNVLFETYVENLVDDFLSYIVTIGSDNLKHLPKELLPSIETNSLVDATGDAKICRMLNCEFLPEDKNNSQPSSLRFIMSGVNTKLFSRWLMEYDNDRTVTTSCNIDNNIMLSTAYTWDSNKHWALAPLFRKAIEENVITEEDSNYFQLFSVAGTPDSIAFNCPRLLNKNLSRTELYIEGRAAILRLSQFCKKYLPGFENAYISSIANSLGIRSSHRVKCKYTYTLDDLKSGKTFDNPVVVSNYPIDIHSSSKNESVLTQVKEYQLPIESLIIKNNLYVIGRCISAEFEALSALRIIPSCFSMGEGLAKYLANNVFI